MTLAKSHCPWNRKLTVHSAHEVLELVHLPLNARLSEGVVVLDGVEQSGEAPEGVRFHDFDLFPLQLRHIERADFHVIMDVLGEEDDLNMYDV